ncbi:MAG: ATP-binding cassette domain-containing protein [Candidatus Thermoplasmatota archaeon]|nr:ATP-binding cassette domain-containing protein [Candidatus Thermoplasmatota archaeon]
MSMIEVKGLTKIYPGGIKAVDNISFTVEKNEIYGLLGPNGAGKTTTIKMLTSALKPTSGDAFVNGLNIRTESLEVRKTIGIVPQDLTADEDLTGFENMYMFAQFYRIPRQEAYEQIERLLDLVELTEAKNRYVKGYSGGMRKRLELAIGLLHNPEILFLDEPTLGLDVQTRTRMWEYIREIVKKMGVTIILTSHYLEEIDSLADRMSIMDKGKIVITGTSDELKGSLKGDVISIICNTAGEAEALSSYRDGIDQPVIKENEVRLSVENSDKDLAKIFNFMIERKITPMSINVHKPSLDQVFLKYTGRTIREAEGGEDVRKSSMNLRRMRA